ncbi:MAG TPA: PD-(D/E)XK motif protein [Candidatus Wunengus sp. YC63]|uniref:PD-(D/E)XK motif protein n=1 Tax=unclassified Candidatus Wunengus TaxID=3367695 RepID=UPI00402774A0
MHYKTLSINTWNKLDNTGDIVTGYHGIFLSQTEGEKSNLLIFKDENGNLHFVISDDTVTKKDILDPKVNGLKIELKKYKFQDFGIQQFIDLECTLRAYISEFTEVVKEISEKIIVEKELPVKSLTEVINNWKSFWASRIKRILSEEEQIGLICELKVLKMLCEINPVNALNSWKGPLKEKYDFVFSDWVFEVKGTIKEGHVHTINGLDQLKSPTEKNLALISFLATKTENISAKSLQTLIEDIEVNAFKNNANMIERFHELLAGCGYSRIHKEEYRKTKFDIYDGKFFTVNDNFPKLTSDHLKQPLDSRVSEIQYTIDLEGLSGEVFEYISFGKYFY